jgi:hypothetical protein
LPGKEDEARKLARETLDRHEEFDASQRRHGITSEEWSLKQTSMGSMVIVRFEGSDVTAAFEGLARSDDAFDAWFKERVLERSGVDHSAPSADPLPEVILSWPD